MTQNRLHDFADIIQVAQAEIQKNHPNLNPLISLSSHLREHGFASDIITIDEPSSKKRIMMLLHDDKPSRVEYQLGLMDVDPLMEFVEVDQASLTAQALYLLIESHFSYAQ